MWTNGQSGNPNGRPKGSVSEKAKVFNEIREYLKEGGGMAKFVKELDKLEGEEYVNKMLQLMEFVIPKQARITAVYEGDLPTITIIGVDKSEPRNPLLN